jgi:hypothetical protein
MKKSDLALCRFLTAVFLLAAAPFAAEAAAYLGPGTVVASKDAKSLYVPNVDAKQIAVVELAGGKLARTIPMPAEPTGMVLSPDGATLYVTCAAAKSTVCVVDPLAGKVSASIPAGRTAGGPAVSPDGKRLFVINLLPIDRSDAYDVAALAAPAKPAKPAGADYRASGSSTTAADVPNDLAFLVDLRRRIQLSGNGPRGLAVIGTSAYVAECFSDTLGVVDLAAKPANPARPVSQIARIWSTASSAASSARRPSAARKSSSMRRSAVPRATPGRFTPTRRCTTSAPAASSTAATTSTRPC